MEQKSPRSSVSANYDHAHPFQVGHPSAIRAHDSGECFITHVDVFLGSLTFTSEQLACSLAVRSKDRGAQVTINRLQSSSRSISIPLRSLSELQSS